MSNLDIVARWKTRTPDFGDIRPHAQSLAAHRVGTRLLQEYIQESSSERNTEVAALFQGAVLPTL
jgi:hypothetical protein